MKSRDSGKINLDILPTPPPPIPDLNEVAASANPGAIIMAASTRMEKWTQRQDRALTKALRRVRWCVFLRVLLGLDQERHFSWCPYEAWRNSSASPACAVSAATHSR